jgi:N-methylhydantoinase A
VIVGIDTGGTNVDAVLVDDEVVASAQVPGERTDPIQGVLDRLLESDDRVDRVVVVTTLVLNAAVQNRLPACTNILVPGPGLHPKRAFAGEENHVADGCVDTRGRLIEDPRYGGEPSREVAAVTAKFGTRNPEPEQAIRATIDYDDSRVALGHASGPGLTFPERAGTTVANAKARPTFAEFASSVSNALDAVGIDAPAYYMKSDGGLLSADAMRSTPARALRGGAAASSLGLMALTGIENAVCVDVGGTTTDVTRVADGLPATEPVSAGDLETGYDGVEATALPFGGDSRVLTDGLAARREGNAAAFGGDAPTLTDALHVAGHLDGSTGNPEAARAAFETFENPERIARVAIESYVDRVVEAVDGMSTRSLPLVAGGVLAPFLADRIAEDASQIQEAVVPEHAAVAGAVGCAVARVSVEVQIRADSARGRMSVTALDTDVEGIERGRTFADNEVEKLAIDHARRAAREAGATVDGPLPVEIPNSRRFNVVEDAHVTGQVVDTTAQVSPGLRRNLKGDT